MPTPPAARRAPRLHREDFPVGHRAASGSIRVDREEVIEFASRFDPQPFHLDDAAAQTHFGLPCARGWHTASMTMRMMVDGDLREAASLGPPGIDELRWVKPVHPGDALRVRFEVPQARPMATRPEAGLVRSRWEVVNQNDEVVMTMEGWSMYRRRQAAPR